MRVQQAGVWVVRDGKPFRFMVGYEPFRSETEVRTEIRKAREAIALLQTAIENMERLLSEESDK